jgi:hypothetical protein
MVVDRTSFPIGSRERFRIAAGTVSLLARGIRHLARLPFQTVKHFDTFSRVNGTEVTL